MKTLNKKLLKALCVVFFAFCFCIAGAFSTVVVASAEENTNCAEVGCAGKYENGVCSADETHYEMPTLNEKDYDLDNDKLLEAVYEIENAGQLLWFGKLVNKGALDANAILMADVDLEGREWKPLGMTELYYDVEYSDEVYYDRGFQGIIEGNYHRISSFNVKLIEGDSLTYGLVGTLSGTVRNLGVEGFVYSYSVINTSTTDIRTGTIAGQMLGGSKVENCYIKGTTIDIGTWVTGGIAGCNYNGTISNCYVVESVVTGSDTRYGYIVGDNRADGSATDRVGMVNNCYTDRGPIIGTKTLACNKGVASVKSISAFTNGEVAALLGSAWGQKLGEQAYPVFGGQPVCRYTICNGAIRYSNDQHENEQCVDVNNDKICDNCGYFEEDDTFYLSTADHLSRFAELVNCGVNTEANAKLKTDIDLTGYDEEIIIGNTFYAYSGTFDGQDKAIKNYNLTLTKEGTYGLFSSLSKATVKNFSIDGHVTITCDDPIDVGVIGTSGMGSTISNIHSSLNIEVKVGLDNTIGGIAAIVDHNSKVEKCSYSGTLQFGDNSMDMVGGIVGEAVAKQTVHILDCAFYGTISSTCATSNQIGGILGYYQGVNLSLQNCLSVGKINTVDATRNGAIIAILRLHTTANQKVINNYYLEGTQPFGDYNPKITNDDSIFDSYRWQTIVGSSTVATAEEIANGKVTYFLNAGLTDGTQVWYQTIAENSKPGFSGGTVYGSTPCAMYFYNTPSTQTVNHSGGTANCKQLAICSVCGQEYGEFGDHVMDDEWTTENGQHFHKCTVKGCDHTGSRENCHGTANDSTQPTCDVCGGPVPKNNNQSAQEGEGLPLGAIIGIVVGGVAVVGVGGFLIFWFVIKKKSK